MKGLKTIWRRSAELSCRCDHMPEHAKYFERLLVTYCSPVLKRHKAANLFHINRDLFPTVSECIEYYNRKWNEKGIYLKSYIRRQGRITLYVYDKYALEHLLGRDDIIKFLQQYDYPAYKHNLPRMLKHLGKRLTQEEFPHEIGVFLGYPLPDVIGFIEHRPCVFSGYWKVYQNPSDARKLFALYDRCKNELQTCISYGNHLEAVI